MSRSISPPPLRRQRQILEIGTGPLLPAKPDTLRVFAWNINGIAPFVTPYLQARPPRNQPGIKSFFRTGPRGLTSRKRKRIGAGDECGSPDSDNDDFQQQGRRASNAPSLRRAIGRLGWPHILCLQEVKIKRGDALTMEAVRTAVNDAQADSILPTNYTNASLYEGNRGVGMNKGDEGDGETLQDGGPEYDVHFNLPCDPHNVKGFGGKMYGVATVIHRAFSRAYINTVREPAWDKEGRVQIIETRNLTFPLNLPLSPVSASPPAKPSPVSESICDGLTVQKGDSNNSVKLAIINVYALNGTSNPYRSPGGSVIGTRHDRKLALHFELLREMKRLEERGFGVVLAGDLNVARDARDGYPNLRTWPRQHVLNRNDFNEKFFSDRPVGLHAGAERALDPGSSKEDRDEEKKLIGFNGIDTFRSLHGDERRYSYYPRGRDWGTSCDRVDLIIASRALGPLLVGAGICENPKDRGPSDHCPVWAEFGDKLG